MRIENLEDLEAWQEARKLCKMIYELIEDFPKTEEYSIKKHFRESSRGVPANIAEGFEKYRRLSSIGF